MQQWEYVTLCARDGIVISANDQIIAKESFWGGIKGKTLHHFLNELGKIGWEVIGVSPITSGGPIYRIPLDVVVILKRPLV